MEGKLVRFAVAALLATSGLASTAGAQTVSDKAAAEGLFDQGRTAMQEGDFTKACGLLERSQHIDPAVGTLLYLAECYEKAGRTASAWATFREAADAATAAKESQRARTGRERAQRLEPLLSRLTIQVAPETQQLQGLTIDRRDKQIQPAVFNVAVPTDPGEYTITASAPGYEPWSGTVTVPERAGRVSITVPALRKGSDADKAAAATAQAVPPPAGTDKPAAPGDTSSTSVNASTAPVDSRSSSQRTMGLVIGAAGVVGVGVGSYFGLRAFSKYGDAKDVCPTVNCTGPEGPSLTEEAKNAATASNIAFGIGLVALAGGAVLYFTAPSPGASAQKTTLHARVGPGSVMLGGTFR
jgi:serine/threonine-protein kinase